MSWQNLGTISILAEDGDSFQVIFMIILGIFWVVGALVAKAKKNKAKANAGSPRIRAVPRKKPNEKDGWQVVSPPPIPGDKPVAVQPHKVTRGNKPSIGQFVKKRRYEEHSKLVQPKPVVPLQHVKSEPLPVLHADGELSSRHECADDGRKEPLSKIVPKPVSKLVSKSISKHNRPQPQKVKPAKVTGRDVQLRIGQVKLVNPQTAQLAMIFHEILSSPVALRDEPRMWE